MVKIFWGFDMKKKMVLVFLVMALLVACSENPEYLIKLPERAASSLNAVLQNNRFLVLLLLVGTHIALLAAELPDQWNALFALATAPLYARLLFLIRGQQHEALVALLLLCGGPALELIVPFGTHVIIDVVKLAFWTGAPAYVAWKTFITIYGAVDIDIEEIFGAIAVYLLIGLVFANFYEALFLLDPGAIRFGEHFPADALNFSEVLYFSFVTLSTLGYGDISPSHGMARMVSIVESIVGLMYTTIMIARFVALHVHGVSDRERD